MNGLPERGTRREFLVNGGRVLLGAGVGQVEAEKTQNPSLMGRREFFQTIAGLGLSVVIFKFFVADRIPTALKKIGEEKTNPRPQINLFDRSLKGDDKIETASSEGNILFMNGGKIEVKFGVDLFTEDEKGEVSQLSYLPGTAHPDITISNPIIVLQKNDKGEILTYYRFFYRSDWRLISAKEAKTIKEADNGRNDYAVSTKIPTEYGKPSQLVLADGKVVDQTIDGDNN